MGWVVILFAWVKQKADIIGTKQYVTLFNKDSLQFFNFRQMRASVQNIRLRFGIFKKHGEIAFEVMAFTGWKPGCGQEFSIL